MVKFVETVEEFDKLLSSNPGKLIVVDFTATWCGPCKNIAPVFEELAGLDENKDVIFVKVDVDEGEEISQKVGIQCMPTFMFYKNGAKVFDFSGANVDKLKEGLAAHR